MNTDFLYEWDQILIYFIKAFMSPLLWQMMGVEKKQWLSNKIQKYICN